MSLASRRKESPEPYEHQDYPALRYRDADNADGYESRPVADASEDAAASLEGYVDSPAEFVEAKAAADRAEKAEARAAAKRRPAPAAPPAPAPEPDKKNKKKGDEQ